MLFSRSILRGMPKAGIPKSPLALSASRNLRLANSVRFASDAASSPKSTTSKWKILKRTTLGLFATAVVLYGANVYRFRHPDPHQPLPDPSKKTLVVLGAGWGATSILRTIDTSLFNVIVVSPRNYFLFTSLLPSTATGSVHTRSIVQPIRYMLRHKSCYVKFYEAECTDVDADKKVIHIKKTTTDGVDLEQEIKYDYLVCSHGAETQTFNIPGIAEYGCFLKEIWDAQKIRARILHCLEQAQFKDLPAETRRRYVHTVVVGGGPTGMEFAGEMADFIEDDLKSWYPELADDFAVTLVEALPSVLPMFSAKLRDYTQSLFDSSHIKIRTNTALKKVTAENIHVEVKNPDGSKQEEVIPYGLLVWAGGNRARPLTKKLMEGSEEQNNRRGLVVDEYLKLKGYKDIFALGDCTHTAYAPTAQVASQQGAYLGQLFNKLGSLNFEKPSEDRHIALGDEMDSSTLISLANEKHASTKVFLPFKYSHQGSLAYVGHEKAIADIEVPWFGKQLHASGALAFYFWRSVYLSELYSLRNRTNVTLDWIRVKLFGRDISSL
ncbi:putative NADH-ubiquinone oxidoreductase C3A11.07, mitochondrial [Schizosaccharomyces pombe]|uniref:Probable NADH-ubiquinone oxidoreductase C3A11.07, mitochondrial n=1 Tax=Schizosaccharomyces pombe (strain 972 / ATCC 24843) TaxID=284812 RepID=NDH1_SCHPO|nr:putative NADH dehydrogenase [Schizosaccharomyces pombe]O14121.1 RecName: Full=Probable NADH-ubiquinone oxidoreductase C3A11.07, mitochondrial; Flags: Precursor [Schizosaccharomyces pombe 972h-]CAB16382.1 NADH dehydrogenase (predicted) [Schizosaccharomyces pombe]|eukprot:NP_594196.1 putative NADH dehydrogenase [Schizosaccharomyces pombe]